MDIGKQRGIALILIAAWIAVVIASYLISDTSNMDYWIFVLVSLLLMLGAQLTLTGRIGLFFPYCFMEDCSEYNVEKIGLLLGTMMGILACMVPFVHLDFIMFWVILCMAIPLECGGIYTCASKKYKVDAE